jgi:hypothetical protein
MPTQVEQRALWRAMEFHGGAEGLAALLDASPEQVRRWSEGSEPVPAAVFAKVVDLVIEHDLAELRRNASNRPKKKAPSRVRFRARACPAQRLAAPVPIVHPFFAVDFAPKSTRQLLAAALDAAMKVAGTDLGNIQLIDPDGALRIEAQHGFAKPFLDFFDRVGIGDASACARALREQRQIFVEDIRGEAVSPGMARAGVLLEAGVLAVASSPVFDADGAAIGVVSTHYRRVTPAEAVDLDAQRTVAERLGDWLESDATRAD